MSSRFYDQLEKLIELQKEQNEKLETHNIKLDKMIALLAGNQLIAECVDPQGQIRTAEECAEVVLEGFSAALCMMSEIEQRTKEYQYQKQEFFIDNED